VHLALRSAFNSQVTWHRLLNIRVPFSVVSDSIQVGHIRSQSKVYGQIEKSPTVIAPSIWCQDAITKLRVEVFIALRPQTAIPLAQ
jgi:hypothetical protein